MSLFYSFGIAKYARFVEWGGTNFEGPLFHKQVWWHPIFLLIWRSHMISYLMWKFYQIGIIFTKAPNDYRERPLVVSWRTWIVEHDVTESGKEFRMVGPADLNPREPKAVPTCGTQSWCDLEERRFLNQQNWEKTKFIAQASLNQIEKRSRSGSSVDLVVQDHAWRLQCGFMFIWL